MSLRASYVSIASTRQGYTSFFLYKSILNSIFSFYVFTRIACHGGYLVVVFEAVFG
jgi:hypothetical protein